MIHTEVMPYIYITDIKYFKRNNVTSGSVLLLSNIKINLNKNLNIIRLPLEYTGKHHEYKESITKNKTLIANQLITIMNVILEIHKTTNRENLYITCPDGLQAAPFIFMAYLVYYGKMKKEDALSCVLSKNCDFFKDGILYYDILK